MWRCWTVDSEGQLCPGDWGKRRYFTWTPEGTAECMREMHAWAEGPGRGSGRACHAGGAHGRCRSSDDGLIPGERCQCGIYGYATWGHFLKSHYARKCAKRLNKVFGDVEPIGKVVDEWPPAGIVRMRRARIIRLFVPPSRLPDLHRLADEYGVPLLPSPLWGLRVRYAWDFEGFERTPEPALDVTLQGGRETPVVMKEALA